MKNIIALIGSHAGNQSNTKKLCENLVEQLQEVFQEELQVEILMANQWTIFPCISCNHCFENGYCMQDSADDMKALKKKILDADVVILGSPVFASNVSGDVKLLIDRLSLWLHIMPLIGKIGIPLITTSHTDLEFVENYLADMLEYMGAYIPVRVHAYTYKGDILLNKEPELKSYLKQQAEIIYQSYQMPFRFAKKQKLYFSVQNERYKRQIWFLNAYPNFKIHFGEAMEWEKQGYHFYNTIDEVEKSL